MNKQQKQKKDLFIFIRCRETGNVGEKGLVREKLKRAHIVKGFESCRENL